MPPVGEFLGGFLGVPPVAAPAVTQQGGPTHMQIAAMKAQVEDVQQLFKGGGFKTQVCDFMSLEDTIICCKHFLPPEAVCHCFPDVGTMLGNVKFGFIMRTDIGLREIYADKVHHTTPQYDVVISFQTEDPEILGFNFCNIKTLMTGWR